MTAPSTPGRRVVACNYTVATSACSEGALCYVCDMAVKGSGKCDVLIHARSRSGRWIQKWERAHRLANFRIKTIPPEHPRHKEYQINSYDPDSLLEKLTCHT